MAGRSKRWRLQPRPDRRTGRHVRQASCAPPSCQQQTIMRVREGGQHVVFHRHDRAIDGMKVDRNLLTLGKPSGFWPVMVCFRAV